MAKKDKKKAAQQAPVVDTSTLCDDLNFASREAYKRLRTNIMFSFAEEAPCRIIGVTSSLRGEGKSVTAINTAYTMAQSGKKVLLIDADMRIPTVAKKLELPANTSGLSNLLVGVDKKDEIIQHIKFLKNNVQLDILTAGELPPNPSELLGSKRMEVLLDTLKKHYNYIIIDLPPVCAVADAVIFSKFADGMMLVVRQDYCRTDSLKEAITQLKFANANIIGFVYNCASTGSKSYGRYRRYGKYGKYYRYGKYGKYYQKYYGKDYTDPSTYEHQAEEKAENTANNG